MRVSKPFLIIAICLVLVLVYVIFFTGGKKKPAEVPIPAATEATATPLKPPAVVEARKAVIRPTALAWKRDPFELPKAPERKAKAPAAVAMRLVAIMDGANGRMAIVDNEIVRRGDMIAEEQVVDIGNDRVVLARGTTKRTLVLEEGWRARQPEPVKQPNPGGVK